MRSNSERKKSEMYQEEGEVVRQTFKAADSTSAADAVFPLTNTYMGVLRSGKLVSSELISLVKKE